jgi:hypothetical protein
MFVLTITDDPKRLIAFMELLHERNQMQKMYVYTRKSDNRKIAILRMKDGTLKTVSYPRMLVENKMMRLLKPDEDVHHLDEDVTNNNINNLTPMDHVLHVTKHANKKYYPIMATCQVCGKDFLWKPIRQQTYYTDLRRNKTRLITCSKSCSSKAGRMTQLGRSI